jgi:hypothetical protein
MFDSDDHERTDVQEWDGNYLGYTDRNGSATDAISTTEGYVGKYDAQSNTTFDRAGVPVGRGNWLMSLFRRE